jgi:hypothetical protein
MDVDATGWAAGRLSYAGRECAPNKSVHPTALWAAGDLHRYGHLCFSHGGGIRVCRDLLRTLLAGIHCRFES